MQLIFIREACLGLRNDFQFAFFIYKQLKILVVKGLSNIG